MSGDTIVLLGRDMGAASELRELVGQVRPFHEILTIDASDGEQRKAFLESLAVARPDVVFVEVRDFRDLAETLGPVMQADPILPVAAYARQIANQTYLELHRLGFQERVIHLPCRRDEVERVLSGIQAPQHLPPCPVTEQCPVVSFLPGKPGSGASTAAWHFANACRERVGGSVALVDLDLNCGVQKLFGGVQPGISIFDAISAADHTGRPPDRAFLPSKNGIDLFCTFQSCDSSRIDTRQFENFLQAIRRAYRLVVVDHSGNWERFSIQALKASAVIYCVCAADLLSLAQTHRILSLVDEEGLRKNVRVLLNRHGSRYGLSAVEAERLAGLELATVLPNAFSQLQRLLRGQGEIDWRSPYFAAVADLAAETLWGLGVTRAENTKRPKQKTRPWGWLMSLGYQRRKGLASCLNWTGRS